MHIACNMPDILLTYFLLLSVFNPVNAAALQKYYIEKEVKEKKKKN